ncbi:hypothetical protein [Roseibium sediminicola]|uniref:Radical SAM protein n=1 Tax=Roseibium sediminicola TaxID=2933272 RepID=A0ABT0H2B9_9HYPH|nr:hypothetical protein [Roseibium sp. CAU 1639]MCK7615223.1 hypothetical protein [Roseibium sp. CAU 1639]
MSWVGGLAEWEEGNTTYLSVAFTWKLDEAYTRAVFARSQGRRVVAGGPALFLTKMQHQLADVAEIGAHHPDAIARHNPDATFASRGCPVGCWFCIVPAMEGRNFTLLPDFPVRPILCDNNLSALPAEYQDHIIARYQAARVTLKDANSGFEPITFDREVYERWKPLVNAGKGPWRFAYDETGEGKDVRRVMKMLSGEPQKRKRVYVLIGNEPFAESMARIQEVIDHGCEPHVQPYMKLNARKRTPHPRHDWNHQLLVDVARWANGWVWKKAPFADYKRSRRTRPRDHYDSQQGLFV